LLVGAVTEDPYYPLDYGFSSEDFSASLLSAFGGHVQYGIAEYADARLNSLNSLLEDYQNASFPGYVLDSGPLVSEQSLSIFGYVAFNGNVPLWLEISYDGNTWNSLEMHDDGVFPDETANDGIYGLSLFPDFSFERLRYRIRYGNGETVFPCNPRSIWLQPANTGLVINELMSNNVGFALDEFGEPEDWFELYNNGSSALNLFSFSASDILSEPGRWRMPMLTLDPGEFALVWADNDEDQGSLHAPFSLNNQGESLYLWMSQSGAYRRVDAAHFGPLTEDYSFGRGTDGSPEWVVFNEPTPGSPNGVTGITDPGQEEFYAFPNPSEKGLFTLNTPATGVVYNAQGALVLRLKEETRIELGNMSGGLYLFRATNGRSLRLLKK
jgi:hypothetical protein